MNEPFSDARFGTDEYLMHACLRTLAAIPRAVREKYLINTAVTGPYSQVAFLVGVNNLMLAAVAEGATGRLPASQVGLGVSNPGTLVTAFGRIPDGAGTVLRVWDQTGVA